MAKEVLDYESLQAIETRVSRLEKEKGENRLANIKIRKLDERVDSLEPKLANMSALQYGVL